MRFNLPRYIPKDSTAQTDCLADAVVYVYGGNGGKLAAIGYSGKRSKSDFHYVYPTEEKRNEHILGYFSRLRKAKQRKVDRQKERRDYRHTLQIGDILHYSWGYDQTNCEFYTVVDRTEKSVRIQEIGGTEVESTGLSSMAGMLKPDPSNRFGPILLKHVGPGNYVPMDFGAASKVEPNSEHYSSWYA